MAQLQAQNWPVQQPTMEAKGTPGHGHYLHQRINPSRLPLELLQDILCHLVKSNRHQGDDQRHLLSTALTCKSWYLASVAMLWAKPDFTSVHSYTKFISYAHSAVPASGKEAGNTAHVHHQTEAAASIFGHSGLHSFRSLSMQDASCAKLPALVTAQHLITLAAIV